MTTKGYVEQGRKPNAFVSGRNLKRMPNRRSETDPISPGAATADGEAPITHVLRVTKAETLEFFYLMRLKTTDCQFPAVSAAISLAIFRKIVL